jgi:hypothetical protein
MWEERFARESRRYDEGLGRLPDGPDERQRQLTRVANAAYGAGLSARMLGRHDAGEWFRRAADRYRQSYPDAPPGSWGRPIGALKARVLAGDEAGAAHDAAWALGEGAATSESPIGRYAGALALLVLTRDHEARAVADTLRGRPDFPSDVADALATLAAGDLVEYTFAIESVLRSFEERDEYLEDVPVADTVLVLQALAARRALAVELSSPLLPE